MEVNETLETIDKEKYKALDNDTLLGWFIRHRVKGIHAGEYKLGY